MSAPGDTPAPKAPAPEAPAAVRRKRRSAAAWAALFAVAMVALVAIVGVATRYGVLLPQARGLIEARTAGLKIGRFGRLKIEGLEGDLWRDFRIRRLTIYDEKGTWLQANQVSVKWRYLPLLRRRLEIDELRAAQVQVIRRPTLAPKTVSRAAPLSVFIADGRARVETLPAFSVRRGLFDAAFKLDVERAGGQKGEAVLTCLVEDPDGIIVQFDERLHR